MVIYCISMQWFREWEGFVKGKDNGNWTEVLPFHSPTPLHPLVLFKCLIKKVKCFPCDLLWRDRVSRTNCQSIRFHRHMGGKKANRFFFFFFSYRKSKFSGFYKQLIFKRNCGVPVPSFDFFFFKEFALVPRVGFLSCSSKMRRQNAFHWCSTCPHIFFFSLLPLLCIVTSIYNSLHLARLQMSVFFLCLDFCSSNICLLSVANGEQILLFL